MLMLPIRVGSMLQRLSYVIATLCVASAALAADPELLPRPPELEPNVWLAEDDGVLSPSGQRYGWDNAAVAMSARGRGGEVDLVLAPGDRMWQDWAVLCDAARDALENRARCVVATGKPAPPQPAIAPNSVGDAETLGQGRP